MSHGNLIIDLVNVCVCLDILWGFGGTSTGLLLKIKIKIPRNMVHVGGRGEPDLP